MPVHSGCIQSRISYQIDNYLYPHPYKTGPILCSKPSVSGHRNLGQRTWKIAQKATKQQREEGLLVCSGGTPAHKSLEILHIPILVHSKAMSPRLWYTDSSGMQVTRVRVTISMGRRRRISDWKFRVFQNAKPHETEVTIHLSCSSSNQNFIGIPHNHLQRELQCRAERLWRTTRKITWPIR